MPEFENNSEAAKQAKSLEPAVEDKGPHVDPIVTGVATAKKPSGFKRFRRSFIAGDASTVGEHVFWNLLLPGLQNVFADMWGSFGDMMIYGERRPYQGNQMAPMQGMGSNSRVSYASTTVAGPRVVLQSPTGVPAPVVQQQFSPHDITLPSRPQAEAVITRMLEILQQYNQVTVANLYSLVNISSQSHLDYKWGWTDLGGADTRRVSGGYLIVLPPAHDLGN